MEQSPRNLSAYETATKPAAIRAYERDHNMPAYGVIGKQHLTTMRLV